jgi:membrane protease subunit HflK
MNWDWDKLDRQRQGGPGGGKMPPPLGELGDKLKNFRNLKLPGVRLLVLAAIGIWLATGIYIVEPDEIGVVKRFGALHRTAPPGPHYHIPFPVESVLTPKVTQIRRAEFGFRSLNRDRKRAFEQGQTKAVPNESLMLTGDENMVDVQFIVQFQIKDPVRWLFNVGDAEGTIKNASEAAMREIIGKSRIDDALTTGKLEIQNQVMELLQAVLDRYEAGIRIVAVQLQDVQPPAEVVEAFKDVASAREDKSKYINEAEAYANDILPKARGQAAAVVNAAQAYRETRVRQATGEAARFAALVPEFTKAPEVTRRRLYLETMEAVLGNPALEKVILSDEAAKRVVPYLPLDRAAQAQKPEAAKK